MPLEIIRDIIAVSPYFQLRQSSTSRFPLPLCHLHSSLRRSTQRLLFCQSVIRDPVSALLFLDGIDGEFDFSDQGIPTLGSTRTAR